MPTLQEKSKTFGFDRGMDEVLVDTLRRIPCLASSLPRALGLAPQVLLTIF